MDAPFDGALEETGPLEDLQVSRNGGLRGAEPAAQLAGAAGLASRERMDHRAAGRPRPGPAKPAPGRASSPHPTDSTCSSLPPQTGPSPPSPAPRRPLPP